MNPSLSTEKLSDVTGVSETTTKRILKHNNYHPDKIQLLQELKDDDK